MWKVCSAIPDEPDKLGPLELMDAVLVLAVFGSVGLFAGIVRGGVVAVILAYLIYRLKRGRPYGALLHRLYALELLPYLPGFLKPRRQHYSPG